MEIFRFMDSARLVWDNESPAPLGGAPVRHFENGCFSPRGSVGLVFCRFKEIRLDTTHKETTLAFFYFNLLPSHFRSNDRNPLNIRVTEVSSFFRRGRNKLHKYSQEKNRKSLPGGLVQPKEGWEFDLPNWEILGKQGSPGLSFLVGKTALCALSSAESRDKGVRKMSA